MLLWEDWEKPGSELQRSLCVDASDVHSIPAPFRSTQEDPSAKRLPPTPVREHRECTHHDPTYLQAWRRCFGRVTDGDLQPFKWNFYSGILAASRQIHQEAFLLFWRTSRFCFNDGDALDEFLSRLTKTQRANLRHVVLFHDCDSSDNIEAVRHNESLKWPISLTGERKHHALRDLDCLELHLQLTAYFASGETDSHVAFQLESLETTFNTLENLRFLRLKRSLVTISYAEYYRYVARHEARIDNDVLIEVAERFRKRLLDPKMSHEERLEQGQGIEQISET